MKGWGNLSLACLKRPLIDIFQTNTPYDLSPHENDNKISSFGDLFIIRAGCEYKECETRTFFSIKRLWKG